jgi:hypothetical protein
MLLPVLPKQVNHTLMQKRNKVQRLGRAEMVLHQFRLHFFGDGLIRQTLHHLLLLCLFQPSLLPATAQETNSNWRHDRSQPDKWQTQGGMAYRVGVL